MQLPVAAPRFVSTWFSPEEALHRDNGRSHEPIKSVQPLSSFPGSAETLDCARPASAPDGSSTTDLPLITPRHPQQAERMEVELELMTRETSHEVSGMVMMIGSFPHSKRKITSHLLWCSGLRTQVHTRANFAAIYLISTASTIHASTICT